jgi:UDP-N-acetylglucosamine 2-epimerase
MKEIFLDDSGVQPDYDLSCNSSDLDFIQDSITDFLHTTKPEFVLVYGDTNSTTAALATKTIDCKLIHIEIANNGVQCPVRIK